MKRLLLVGAGHAHALVLLEWARRPLADTELVVVAPQALAPYSGMVPGWLAGRYRDDEITVDVARLAGAAGARWIEGELHALNPARQVVTLADGRTLGYDLLSLNVGSTLTPPSGLTCPVLAMRPLAHLRGAWNALLQRWPDHRADGPFHVTAVGAGAAGFESLLAVLARLRAAAPQHAVRGRLVAQSATLLSGLAPGAVRAAGAALARAGVEVALGRTFVAADAPDAGLVLWATGAEAHAWQCHPARRGALAVSARGFVAVDETLRSTSHPQVFAAGDCADLTPPLPKAGVYAVRMGPLLARNLRAALAGGSLVRYAPQRRFLVLLATADGRAIAARGGLAAEGRWAWQLKDRIDRAFVRRFDTAPPQS